MAEDGKNGREGLCFRGGLGACSCHRLPNLSPVPPQQHANLVMSQDPYKVAAFGKPYAVAMQYLWCDAGIRACYERRREFHLLDSAV